MSSHAHGRRSAQTRADVTIRLPALLARARRRVWAEKSAKPARNCTATLVVLLFYLPFCNLLPKSRKSALGASIHSC